VTTTASPISLTGPPEAIAKALAVEPAKRTPEQKATLANAYRAQDAELARLTRALAEFPLPSDKRLIGAQDLAWSLINTTAFLFNH